RAVAVLAPPAGHTLLPLLSLALGISGGLFAIGYAASHYGDLPPRVPLHFGFSGAADAWTDRSFGSVFLLPLSTLVSAVLCGGLAVLVANAKRALRDDDGTSLEAQERFRASVARYLAIITLLITAAMVTGSVSGTDVALGRSARLHPLFPILLVAQIVFVIGGAIFLALRRGQGGSRLERRTDSAPLTDGLADNRLWRLGLFYVNRDDPSILVEHRFGLGYTVNLGNWKGILVLATVLILPLGILLLCLLTL
ncbi:MAG TPA: DUF5808 domain-containing protein, partial [Candidatus Polarisedimenticolia bacterium]|nr:DUF5808 domain-containing protein [Candidatus Polarisedimenticolia bacterium]